MRCEEAILKATELSKQERLNSSRVWEDNEGVWIEVYRTKDSNGFSNYNFECKGEKVFAVEATKNGRMLHNY